MSKNFFPFFLECSFVEQDKVKKRLFTKLAFNDGGGLIFNRGNRFVLSCEGNTEFKIPSEYSSKEHARLSKMLGK
jgi:hypothetical protein